MIWTQNPYSFHQKNEKKIQISSLTQPIFELQIWLRCLLVPEGHIGSVLFNTTNDTSRICSSKEIFRSTLKSLVSGKAETTGVITLFSM